MLSAAELSAQIRSSFADLAAFADAILSRGINGQRIAEASQAELLELGAPPLSLLLSSSRPRLALDLSIDEAV